MRKLDIHSTTVQTVSALHMQISKCHDAPHECHDELLK